jgi:1,4-alpha-glucan branching enzyme
MSSWGQGGFAEVWLEGSNDWVYRHLDKAADRMARLVAANAEPAPMMARALDQAARELLLAQASDWAFIMKTGTTVEYARKRTQEHLNHFLELASQVEAGMIDEEYLAELEMHHNIFPRLDHRVYGPVAQGARAG